MRPSAVIVWAFVASAGCLYASPGNTFHEQENGLLCKLIIPTPYRIHGAGLEIQLVLKNVSHAPIRVCTLNGKGGGISKNWSGVLLGPDISEGAVQPPIETFAQSVVAIPPGASLTLSTYCEIPETSPFQLVAGYDTTPGTARQLNIWQGQIYAPQVTLDLKPHVANGNSDQVVASFKNLRNQNAEADSQKTAAKIVELLHAAHITAVAVASEDSTEVSVASKETAAARKLITEALNAKKLDLMRISEISGSKDATIPSPDKTLSVDYKFFDRASISRITQVTLNKVMGGKQSILWTFNPKPSYFGPVLEFSWSPDAHYLLLGINQPDPDMTANDHAMALDLVDTRATPVKERDLNLIEIEKQVAAQLPKRPVGAFAHYSHIDFDHVEWTSATQCRLHYIYELDRQAGDAVIDLDLAAPDPQLKIVKVTPQPEL